MIRVLHTEWSDGWGGQEIRIVNEMLAMRQLGVEVFLACKEQAVIRQKAIEAGIDVFVLPFRGNTDFKTLFAIMKIVKKNNIDIVNTHSGKDTWVGGFAAKLAGAKFIRTRHLSNRIRTSRLNFINELADFIFTTGESVKSNMIRENRISPDRILSIPTGIDVEKFNPLKVDRKMARERFAFQDDEFIVGNVAVLRRFKRHDRFLETIRFLLDQFPEKKIRGVIAGDGPQRENLEKMIHTLNLEKSVTLVGHVDNVAEFLQAIDLFLLTSDSGEGVPQSVMQALLMEKPVVATDAGSTGDLYRQDNFMLVGANEMDDFKQSCLKMLDDTVREKYQATARQFVASEFSQQKMAEKILNVYQKLLST